ncbi:hypothetical protein PoB_004937700 [Plakobranchus ocellatus]|uniref:ISXO2-like transposase domain-containing protein n=1 Tax=Plakobranchus ocellatus TaxID=259542 RepID=A0AAV4BU60_9GAST|nr:hypothetical protein PoB_004937700 [Plakobranchus ocellatus]
MVGKQSNQIGGMDANGDSVVFGMEEQKYFQRNYHRGQWKDGHWVFEGIEYITGKCFLAEISDSSAATLEPLIHHYILPGFHIVSDGWPAYTNIVQIGGRIYLHSVDVHQQHFIDPDNPDIHTKPIENMWMRVKQKFGISQDLFHPISMNLFFIGLKRHFTLLLHINRSQ